MPVRYERNVWLSSASTLCVAWPNSCASVLTSRRRFVKFISTYGRIVFETAVQYAPVALPWRGNTSTWPASRQSRKISAIRGENRVYEESTRSIASPHEKRRGSPIGAYWSASESFSSPSTFAFARNQRCAIG